MASTPQQTAGAAIALAAIMAGLIGGYRYLTHHSPSHVSVDWQTDDAGQRVIPADAVCLTCNVRGSPEAFAFFGLPDPPRFADGGIADTSKQYAVATVCASPSDAGEQPLPPGIDGLNMTCESRRYAFDAGGPQLEIWADTNDTPAPFRCACATGPDCYWRPVDPRDGGGAWQVAPLVTMQPNTWDGGDCRPKTCVQFFGTESMPPACRAHIIDGGAQP